jgi:hypothetical protein
MISVTFWWSLCARNGKPSLISTQRRFFALEIGLGTGPHGDICGFVLGEAVTAPALPRGGGFLLSKAVRRFTSRVFLLTFHHE